MCEKTMGIDNMVEKHIDKKLPEMKKSRKMVIDGEK